MLNPARIQLITSLTALFCCSAFLHAQPFSPAAGHEGSDALNAEDARFISWALTCTLERGPGIFGYPDSVEVSNGVAGFATGKAGNEVVSLGDGGRATLYFDPPITDGSGPDFAVFENSFDGNFLELGFVEVSSDGLRFIRFPASSLTQTDTQIGPWGTLDPVDIHNLAGKYSSGWGVPFDLAELKDSNGLNLDHIIAVRVIDVIGILDEELGSRDARGRLINDPFPTPFETGGFDLDAVGVLNRSFSTTSRLFPKPALKVYPNPCSQEFSIEFPAGYEGYWQLLDMTGRTILRGSADEGIVNVGLSGIENGTYILQSFSAGSNNLMKIIKDSR